MQNAKDIPTRVAASPNALSSPKSGKDNASDRIAEQAKVPPAPKTSGAAPPEPDTSRSKAASRDVEGPGSGTTPLTASMEQHPAHWR